MSAKSSNHQLKVVLKNVDGQNKDEEPSQEDVKNRKIVDLRTSTGTQEMGTNPKKNVVWVDIQVQNSFLVEVLHGDKQPESDVLCPRDRHWSSLADL